MGHPAAERSEDRLKLLSGVVAIVVASAGLGMRAQDLILTNPLKLDRTQEVIETPLQPVLDHLHALPGLASAIVAEASGTGQRVPDQAFASTYDAAPDKLLLLVQLPARGTKRIVFHIDI